MLPENQGQAVPALASKKALSYGVDIDQCLPAIQDGIPAVLEANKKRVLARALAFLVQDGITVEQFNVRLPGIDPATALEDPGVAALVEEYSNTPEIQEEALQAQLRRTLKQSVSVLSRKLEDPECSATMAKDVGDAMVRIAGLLDRRGVALPRTLERSLMMMVGTAHISTPSGGPSVYVDGPETALAVIREMGCTTQDEADAVIEAMRYPMGGNVVFRGE